MKERTSAPANEDLKPLYARSLLSSFGAGAAGPFMDTYAVKQLGASASDMGWFQSTINLSSNVFQMPWGKLNDKVGRSVPFLVVGSLVSAILWIPLLFVASAKQLILIMAIQAIIGSMVIPSWAALIGKIVPASTRGMATSSINLWATVGSLFSTLLSGYIMITVAEATNQIFLIPLLIAAGCGIIASFMPLFIKEKQSPTRGGGGVLFGILDVAKQMRYTPDFSRYCLVSAVFGFFMSLSWPLMSITRVRVLGLSMLEIALLLVMTGLVTTVLQPWLGRLVDRVGRKPLMIASRAMLILVPIFYAFSPNFYYLLLLHGITGVSDAFGTAALFAYLLDVAPEKHRGSFAAFYNLVNGSALFAGSLLSGYLSDYLATMVGVILSMQIVYVVSAIGRVFGTLTFTSLREPYKYPSTLREELRRTFRRMRKRD